MLSEIERFVNWVRRRSPGARTWKDYGYDLRFFVEVVGDRPLKEITFKDLDHFVGVQSEKGFKPSTINRRLASVISLYGFLAAEDDELVCPVIVRRHHVREAQRLPRPVGEGDLKRFFAVIEDKRDRAMFLLMLRCGLRIGEVAALRLVDLFLEEEYPRVVVRGKGSRERGVYLSPQAKRCLQDYLAERPQAASEFVFLSYLEDGLSTTAIHNCLLKYRALARVHITAHRLRHSFANDLLNAGCRVTSIQRVLGHRDLSSTLVYARLHDQTVADDYFTAMQRVEERLEIVQEIRVEVVKVQVVFPLIERLEMPELCYEERLKIARQLREALASVNEHAPPSNYGKLGEGTRKHTSAFAGIEYVS